MVSAITDMPNPNNVKHFKSYLQTCSWCRKFIKNISEVSRALCKLTRKNVPQKWDEIQEETLKQLKQALVTAPILIQADEKLPFTTRTDASGYALGAVLTQGDKDEERWIEYASRLLTQAERNYNTTQREALAVEWGVH